MATFGFRFSRGYRLIAMPLGITPSTTSVVLASGELAIRFGPWSLRTPISNVAGVAISGPYNYLKTIGPPHLSLVDRGVTFATNRVEGLCIQFEEPVPAIEPSRRIRHPAATVTVDDVSGLQTALFAAV